MGRYFASCLATYQFYYGYSLRRSDRDCRNPEARDGKLYHILVAWIPAIPAGMTGYFYGYE
jgi:hypothetical protein